MNVSNAEIKQLLQTSTTDVECLKCVYEALVIYFSHSYLYIYKTDRSHPTATRLNKKDKYQMIKKKKHTLYVINYNTIIEFALVYLVFSELHQRISND